MYKPAQKILITGANGQLGRALASSVPTDAEVVLADRSLLDLSDDASIEAAVDSLEPNLIINAAAYTAVDKAESEQSLASQINGRAPARMAALMQQSGGRMIQLSTDFVFSGATQSPWQTGDATQPINHYGASKLAGEQAVSAALGDRAAIVRTAWVYAPWGNNFLRSMLRLMAEREQLTIVSDQIGTPTSATGLASFLWRLADSMAADPTAAGGIWHWTDAGVASWYDFAVAILQLGQEKQLLQSSCTIRPILASQFPTAATRPSFSVLDKTSTWQQFDFYPPHWRAALSTSMDLIQRDV